ncbi:NAD-dependent epimerase/dehydratase family protein [Kocuria sp. HSID16901]|uniref:NAD-dependent epimerase/dehydratase family protein n=1 Tax=Kocuria sp. HSID16901 TaxID=2419505 RepID=UPI000660B4E4|nr:NAD-dependent epimerase/dehydratase family protein [Kocuria sp. HSID16901]RUQ21692.1 NAD-dependent epimerase/dehydratase family protein [Kocuria sp. HSID16901]
MKYLVTGAGQIGTQMVRNLVEAGHQAVVLRRSQKSVEGAEVLVGDVSDRRLLARAMRDVAAVFHCVHAAYDADAWRKMLPDQERAVMDLAADANIPVVFPESVYGFGAGAEDLTEGDALAPRSPMGQVRAELLAARREHDATTLSIVASDLWGPTAEPSTSVAHLAVMVPRPRGRAGYAMGNPRLQHTLTYIPDLATSMIAAAENAAELAPKGDLIAHAPSITECSLEELNRVVSEEAGVRRRTIRPVPAGLLRVMSWMHPMLRELSNQSYLWTRPVLMRPGILSDRYGLEATPLRSAVRHILSVTTP